MGPKKAKAKERIFVGTFDKYKKIRNEALQDIKEGPTIPAVLDKSNDIVLSEKDNDSLLQHRSVKLRV